MYIAKRAENSLRRSIGFWEMILTCNSPDLKVQGMVMDDGIRGQRHFFREKVPGDWLISEQYMGFHLGYLRNCVGGGHISYSLYSVACLRSTCAWMVLED